MCGCVPVRLIEPLLFSVYSRVYTRVPVCIYTRSISYARPCVRRLAGMRRMARPRTKGWERKELGQCDFANSFHTRDRNLTSTTACCSSCFTNRRCAPFRLPPLDIPFKRKNNLLMGVIGPIFGDKGIPRWNSRSPANSFLWEELADSCLLEYSISVKVYCFTGLITFTFGAIIYFARYSLAMLGKQIYPRIGRSLTSIVHILPFIPATIIGRCVWYPRYLYLFVD